MICFARQYFYLLFFEMIQPKPFEEYFFPLGWELNTPDTTYAVYLSNARLITFTQFCLLINQRH